MTSLEIKLLVSLACVATIYAFVTETRMVNRARKLRDWLQHERPDLWKDINLVARNWRGGQPGLKLLYQRKVIDLPRFDLEYEHLQSMERKQWWGIGIGITCIGLVLIGSTWWGWQW